MFSLLLYIFVFSRPHDKKKWIFGKFWGLEEGRETQKQTEKNLSGQNRLFSKTFYTHKFGLVL
jgi:hypothetical protein